MNIGLDLMVFCVKDDDVSKVDMGIDLELSECVLRPYTFFNIDYITIYRDSDDYCLVGSCGDDFIVNDRYEVVKYKMEQIRLLRFN